MRRATALFVPVSATLHTGDCDKVACNGECDNFWNLPAPGKCDRQVRCYTSSCDSSKQASATWVPRRAAANRRRVSGTCPKKDRNRLGRFGVCPGDRTFHLVISGNAFYVFFKFTFCLHKKRKLPNVKNRKRKRKGKSKKHEVIYFYLIVKSSLKRERKCKGKKRKSFT